MDINFNSFYIVDMNFNNVFYNIESFQDDPLNKVFPTVTRII